MKNKNLILMVLAAMLLLPASVNAKTQMGWLHIGRGNTTYYDESAQTISVKYNGTTYQAYPVLGYTGVYYVPNEKAFGTRNTNLKVLYLKNASLSKNIDCTKSTTNLGVVVSGKCSITNGGTDNFRMETGNLTIEGENGPTQDVLTMKQTASDHNIWAGNGSVTLKNVTVDCTTQKDWATIDLESKNYKLTLNNCNVTARNPIYLKGGMNTPTNCSLASGLAWNSSNYYICRNGVKANSVTVAVKTPTTTTTTTNTSSTPSEYYTLPSNYLVYGSSKIPVTGKSTRYFNNGKYECIESGMIWYVPNLKAFCVRGTIDQDDAKYKAGVPALETKNGADLKIYVLGTNVATQRKDQNAKLATSNDTYVLKSSGNVEITNYYSDNAVFTLTGGRGISIAKNKTLTVTNLKLYFNVKNNAGVTNNGTIKFVNADIDGNTSAPIGFN